MSKTIESPNSSRSGSNFCSPAGDVRERPILFNCEMVRAILDGRKTQTRRIVKPMPEDWIDRLHGNNLRGRAPYDMEHYETGETIGYGFQSEDTDYFCKYGRPGDRLWVRETCSFTVGDYPDCRKPSVVPHDAKVWYREANDRPTWAETKWHPSIFMPRWASRITLEIVNVRVERLQDISRGDCMAEGCPFPNIAGETDPVQWFAELWERINHNWDANPWLWVVEFQMI